MVQNDGYDALSYTFYVKDTVGNVCSTKWFTKSHWLMYAVFYNKLFVLYPDNKYIQWNSMLGIDW